MATLPGLTITDAQLARCIDAFGTVDNYHRWLRYAVNRYVLASEQAAALNVTTSVRARIVGDPPDDPIPEV